MKKLSEPEAHIIRGGFVYDGSGEAPFRADIAIRGGIIEEIGPCGNFPGYAEIDAGDLLVSPGFIDIHSHSDEHLLVDPRSPSKVFQGITTEVIGNCGFSPAPLYGESAAQYHDQIEETLGVKVTWTSCEEFFSIMETQGLGINCIMLAGNGNIRGGVLGYCDRKAENDHIECMKAHLAEALEQGAWGLSSGLIYVPSCFADKEELAALAGVCRDYGAFYATHMRGEGDCLLEALSECLAVSALSGVSLQISHLKASGERNWKKLEKAVEMIEQARGRGSDIWCDVYPYAASSTGLASFFPRWVREGGRKALLQRLRIPEIQQRLKGEFKDSSLVLRDVMISSVRDHSNHEYPGMRIAELAARNECEPIEMAMSLLVEEGGDLPVINFSQSEDNVLQVLNLPFSLIGTDASARSPEGPLSYGMPHPRAYGTCARVLGHYVRERESLSLTRALDKMTLLPARRLGLAGRGALKKGYHADIAILDPRRVNDCATYTEPHRFPEGIEYVMVNGVLVINQGKHTGALPGMVLKRGKETKRGKEIKRGE